MSTRVDGDTDSGWTGSSQGRAERPLTSQGWESMSPVAAVADVWSPDQGHSPPELLWSVLGAVFLLCVSFNTFPLSQ